MSETFYRKYRSQTFADMQGQAHIVQTLSNAILHDRLSHAYIFSGPRGTGKTSAARIFSKALNCRKGKSPQPCLECDLCQKITRGQSVDVVEIDAASNTGVDNIRTLNDQIHYLPVECAYKIYIIDEAHMLSTGAFNAMLKTLEEPPANTVFILATTESHKIPITIQSRCQHLHFRKLTSVEIKNQLNIIAKEEKISIPEEGLGIIARNSSGCMRDAISLFNQLYSFAGTTIQLEDIDLMLGISSFDKIDVLMTHFLEEKTEEAIVLMHTFFEAGAHLMQLAADVILVLRQLLYVHMNLNTQIDADDARLEKLKILAKKVTVERLSSLLESFAKLEVELRWFPNPELLFEIRFVSLMRPPSVVSTPVFAVPAVKPAPAVTQPVAKQPVSVPPPASVPVPVQPQSAVQAPVAKVPNSDTEKWMLFLQNLKTSKPPLFSILDRSEVLALSETSLSVKLKQDFQFFRDKLNEQVSKTAIESLLKEAFGKPLKLSFTALEKPVATDIENDNHEVVKSPIVALTKGSSQKMNQIVAMFEGTLLKNS